jgi:phage-related protein
MLVVTARSNPLGQRIKMNNAKAKKEIASQAVSNRKWTKYYLQAINDCIDEGDWEQAQYMAMQLAPLWGEIENTIIDIREAQAGA